MTSTTAHPGHFHLSTTSFALALAGAVLGVGAGYGVAALVLEDPIPAAPTLISEPEAGARTTLRSAGSPGTNAEERVLTRRTPGHRGRTPTSVSGPGRAPPCSDRVDVEGAVEARDEQAVRVGLPAPGRAHIASRSGDDHGGHAASLAEPCLPGHPTPVHRLPCRRHAPE